MNTTDFQLVQLARTQHAHDRLRSSFARLNELARLRVEAQKHDVTVKGRELVQGVVRAEAWLLVAFAFGVGLLLGRSRPHSRRR